MNSISLRRVPRIHEHGAASPPLVMHHIGRHIAHMIQLGQAIALRVVNPVIDDPVLSGIRIHIHTRHHTDAFDNPVRIAAVLPPHQLDLARKILVDNRVVEHLATGWRRRDHVSYVVPHQMRRHLLIAQKSIDRVVTHIIHVVGKIRERRVNRTHQ